MERLLPAETVLLVVDVQERLAPAMPPERLEGLMKNAALLLDAAEVLGIPVVASEQYPQGLGPTLGPIAERLSRRGVAPWPKTTFDACSDLAIARRLADLAPRAVVVVGMEAHVCVFQTARELVRRGYATYVAADAVASRREENRQIGLSLCERAGAVTTAAETVVFDWMERAGTPAFKAIAKLVR